MARDEVATEPKTAKLTVALPLAAIKAIEEIADRHGKRKTKTQVLQEAIGLMAFVEREVLQRSDAHLLIKRGDETIEVTFPDPSAH